MAEMATQTRRLRADEVPHIPIDDPASSGYKLVDGQLVTIMPAKPTHAWLLMEDVLPGFRLELRGVFESMPTPK